MQKEKDNKVGGPYDKTYAAQYNDIWIHSEAWAPEAKNHVDTIAGFIKPDTTWLDAACGTGYFLSQFPGVRRAGFDLSEAMLGQANKANPDALFFRQMNLANEAPEWNGKWNLVTCTGQPYSYLETIDEIEKVADNLASWTSDDGICMVTPVDIFDMTYTRLPIHYKESEIPDNTPVIKGIIWNLQESGVHHQNMIFPLVDQWVRWMSKHFNHVEVLFWPHDPPHLRIPRRVIICREKKLPGDVRPAKVTEKNLLAKDLHALDFKRFAYQEKDTFLSYVSNKQLLKEFARRIRSGKFLHSVRKKLFSRK